MKIALIHFFAAGSLCVHLSGCTTEQFSRNVYEGVKHRNEALNSAPPDYTAPRVPGYDEYERERRGLDGRGPTQ